ncbi:MAG: glycosyltransferase [Nocardioides sp.]|jgi:glycosyltransferase involved in cell wall biosynthesis|uniref:glycosyltransferase n=1 Tax=Nocardioides sp. TaxID=35761 RepID=UPI00262D8EF1|nr:glycosyltransferase [Nocardioides sp.]MCW2835759.1 glycosyltransferase [Nocardioides sp.]
MTRSAIAIAHDYLTQRGGAERVVLAMLKAFPGAPLHTTLYDPDSTYPEFRDADVTTSKLNEVALFRRDHRLALPLLAAASSRMRIEADLTVASSSGWAHGFPTDGRKIVYCHNPARWLYQTDEYLGRPARRHHLGPALLAMRPALGRWDRRAAETVDRFLANSRVVQRRIQDTYGRDAEVLHPPHSMDPSAAQEPVAELSDLDPGFALVVSRLLAYKNVDAAIGAARLTARPLVVIGHGPEAARLRTLADRHVRILSGLTDAQLRWVYARAGVLVSPSHEDFGLTPLEAAAFGVPTVALGSGGFLETVVEGSTGLFFEHPTARSIGAALADFDTHAWDPATIRSRADEFSEDRFIWRLTEISGEVLAGVPHR